MRLAALFGLTAAPVHMVNSSGKDVLLVSRFVRAASGDDWLRHSMFSVLMPLQLDAIMECYAS